MVVGSAAAAAWGVVRTTRDVDVVALLRTDQLDLVVRMLEDADLYVPVEQARPSVGSGGSFNVLDAATGGKADVFVVAPDDAFEAERLRRRVRADVLGVPAFVVTPEDVVLAKSRWRLESRSEVQWRDCVEIAAVNQLDVEYLRAWGSRLRVSADLEDLLALSD